ncbi:MAG: fimbrial protein pilin [Candidatus Saccharibacteria bacterium]|jgi:prepilin-type N-terminal cleavage/methylation domain-containing protein|nr:fimbrial protein pilin [Candidatus Saccharibacteria bacterium]
MWAKQKQIGFTIVELLIVIVVIGILAAITIVAYNGVQNRAQDTKRVHDAQAIVTALEAQKTVSGSYPWAVPNDPSGWEVSKNTPATFISSLKSSGTLNSFTPVDPINTGNYFYKYYKYSAGNAGCDAARGDYYVLVIQILSSKAGNGQGPGFSCSGRDWGLNEGAWVTGSYTN